MKLVKGLEHKNYEEHLRVLKLLSLVEKQAEEKSHHLLQLPEEVAARVLVSSLK